MKITISTLFSILTFSSLSSLAIEPMDNYYSNNILDAVNQAKEKPHHYDYSNTYRYKRTTAQSIQLDRLKLDELENTHLTIDGKRKLSLDDIKDTEIISLKKAMPLPENENLKITTEQSIPVNSEYHSQIGSHKSTDVVNQGVMISTPRP